MHKREFLRTAAAGTVAATAMAASASSLAQHGPRGTAGPVLLTVSGLIGKGNRAALDPRLDQLMARQKLAFDKAHVLDFAALAALAPVRIRPTLEYDNQPHGLAGPLLLDVARACGVSVSDRTSFLLRAVDGYAARLSAADASRYRFIVATHLDDRPMALGGLGPLWAVYDADRFADMAAKPVTARFGSCPWALYHIEVLEG